MSEYRCTYCLGEVSFDTDTGHWVHTTDGQRITTVFGGIPGDYVSEAHNHAGTPVNSADVEEVGEDN